MRPYKDIMGNPLQVGDRVIFSRGRYNGSLYKGKIVKETSKFFIVQELHILPWTGEETCREFFDRRVDKNYTKADLLKI